MNTARLAFVGCGSHATHNIFPVLRFARCTLEAVCDLDPAAAERNARDFGAKAIYSDFEKLIDEVKPDGVLVVGPPELHYAAAKAALIRGIPAFVEKPPAPDLKKAEELASLARQNNTFLMPGYMKRHGLPYRKIQGLIASGNFVPAAASIRYGHWANSDLTGMLLGMSSHAIDLALSFFGKPASIFTHTTRRAQDGAVSIAATLVFDSSLPVQLMLDSSQPRIQERLEISGLLDGGNSLITVENVQHMEIHRQGRNGIDLLAPSAAEIEPDFDLADIQIWRPDYAIPNMGQSRHFFQGYAGEIREFVDAILERREPSPGTDDSLSAMRVIDAILRQPNGFSAL